MKQAIAIFTAFIIMLSSMSNALLVAEFKLNQSEIERLYCVNKAKPAMHCHGKCHLTKQLVENNSHKGQPSPMSQLENAFKINFFHQHLPLIASNFNEEKNKPTPVGQIVFTSRLFGKSMFQPPDNQSIV